MKRILFLTLMAAATTAFAAENDTLVIEKPQRVTIITGDSLQSISVKGKEGDSHFDYQNTIQLIDSNYVNTETYNKSLWELMPFGKKKEGEKRGNMQFALIASFSVGFTTAVGAADGVNIPVGPSWEFMWDIAQIQVRPWKERNHYFYTGFGLDWRNYRMTDQNRFVEQPDGQIVTTPYPQGSNPDFSRIKVLSLTVPFTYGFFPFKQGLFRGFEIGPVLNFNVYSSIKTRYSIDGEKQKDITKGLHRNPVTVDLMVKLQMKYFNIYAKYSPCNVLDTAYGPKFRSVSFGVGF